MDQHIIATQSDDNNSLCSLEQYKKYSAKFLRQRLKERIFQGQKLQADNTTVFASILFADISGFTRLSSRLSCEELKTHINEYFTKLLGIIDENNGDVVKFCGDAVMIMWAVPIDATETVKSAVVTMSALCALQLLEECGVYKKYIEYTDNHLIRSKSLGARAKTSINSRTFTPVAEVNTSNDSPPPTSTTSTTPLRTDTVELSLHCGIACGEVHCMILGDTQRREFLLSGPALQYMGEAEALAQAGQVCMHPAAYERIKHILHAEPVGRPAAIPQGKTTALPEGHMPSASANGTAAVAVPTTTVVVDSTTATVVIKENLAGATDEAAAEVFLLTGRLSDRLYQRRTQPSRSSASSTTATADPSALRLDTCSLGTTLPLTASISTELHSSEGVSTNTALYLASLAQELTARTPHYLPSRSGHTTPTHRRSTGAEGGRAAARHGEGRSFLSRFNGSPLRCSLSGPVHDQDSAVLEVGEEQVSDSSDLDSPFRSRGTEQRSFLTPSVSPLAQSGLPGDLARRPLRSRMSAALSHTRSSLGFLQVSWSSLVSSPSTSTYTTSQAPLLTAGGEEGLGADPSAGLRCCSEERSDTEQTDGLSPTGLDSSPGSPTAAALSSTYCLHKRQRRLPVTVLKKKLKYNTTASFVSVRTYQNNWQHRSVLSTSTEHSSTSNSLLGYKSESSSQFVTQTGAKRARLSRELCKFMHESAVRAIEAGTVACLSEVRDVAVVFTQIHDLDKEFKIGAITRPQKVFCALLRTLRQHGGSLRQFVVDDKGCVAIACFGLAGSCNQNNCVSAVEYAVSLRTLLQTLGCRTSSGVTLGRLYCGLVGAGSRCEYAVMGSSVNLAARLMAAAAKDVTDSVQPVAPMRDAAARRRSSHSLQQQHRHSVLVDSTVYAETQHHFQYRQMAHIIAKGYAEPVQVFATVRKLNQSAVVPVSATVGCSGVVQSRDLSLPGARIDEPAPPVLFLEREDQLSAVRRAFTQTGTAFGSTSVPCLLVTGTVGVGRSTLLQHALSVLPPQHCIATVKVDPVNQYLGHDLVRELLCQVLGIPSAATIRELTMTSSTTAAAATGTEDSHMTPPPPSLASSPLLQPRRDSAARVSIPSLAVVSTATLAAIKLQQQSRTGKLRNTARSQRRATETPAGIKSSIPMVVAPLPRCCSSSYLDASTTERLPLIHNMHCTTDNTGGTVHNSDTAASAVPLSPHTVRYTPKRQHAQNSATSLVASCTTAIAAAEEITRRRDVNTKIQAWCEQHLPFNFTLSQSFAACHPQLDFCDALSTHLQSTQEVCTEDHDMCTQTLKQLSTWPLHSILYLLNPILNSTLVSESPQPLQELLLHTGLSEVEELLQKILLEVLLLSALGAPLPGGVCADCCGTWVLAVDDLHLADQESQALLLRVIAATQRLTGTTHSPSTVDTAAAMHIQRGGLLLTMAVGGGCTELTCTQEAAGAHTRTSAGTSPRRTTQRSQRYAQLRTSLCLDTVALCTLRDSSDLSPERLLELLKLHCECTSLSLLSKAATERILQETLGPQHWRWLLNNASTALGTAASSAAPLPDGATATTGLPALPRLSLHGVGTLIVHRRRRRRSTVLSPSCLLGIAEGNNSATTTTVLSDGDNTTLQLRSGGRCFSEKRARTTDTFLPDAHNCDTLCSSIEQDNIVELIFTLAQKGLAVAVTDICTSLRETIVSGAFSSIQQVPAVERRSKLILEVLDGLYSLDVAVLKAAAVVGTDFDIPLLSVTLAGMDLPQCTEVAVLVPALRRLIDAGLLKTVLKGAHFTGTSVTKLDERTYTDNSESESGHFSFAEAATQLVVYNLMLDTQRSAAHSVVARYLEHRYRCHCTHTQLLQIAQHYFLSSNITKKLEYMRRTAEYYASSDDNSSAVDRYAELVLLTTGSSLEHLLELCQCRELAAIHTLTAMLTTAAQPGSCASPPNTTPLQLQIHTTTSAQTNPARSSWRHRLFHNQVAVAEGDQARERPLSKQELRDRVSAALAAPASVTTTAVLSALPMPGVHSGSPINSSSSSASLQGCSTLSKLILHRRVLRRKVALTHHCSTALPLPCTPTPTIPAIAVRTSVGILGITLVDVAVWIGHISDLLIRSGEREEGTELCAVCLHLFDCSGVVDAKPAVSLTPQMSSTMQSQCAEDCIEEMSASTEGTECLDAHTRSALEFLDQETESYYRQQQQQQQLQQALPQTQIGGSNSLYSSSLLRPVGLLARFLQLSTKTQYSASTSRAAPHNSSSPLRPLSPPCSLINAQEVAQLRTTVDSIVSERDRPQQGRWTRRRTTRMTPKSTTTTAVRDMPATQRSAAAAVDTLLTAAVEGCPVLQVLLATQHHTPALPAAAVHRQLAVLQGLVEQTLHRGDSLTATLLLEEILCALSATTLHSADAVWGHDAALLSQQYTQCMCMLSIALRHCGSAEAAISYYQRALSSGQQAPLSCSLLSTAARHLAASGQLQTAIKCLSHAQTAQQYHHHSHIAVSQLQLQLLFEQIWLQVLVGDLSSADKALAGFQQQLQALSVGGSSDAWQQQRHWAQQLQVLLEIAHGGPALEEVGLQASSAGAGLQGSAGSGVDPQQGWVVEVLSVYRSVVTALEYGYVWRPVPPPTPYSSNSGGSGQHASQLAVTLTRLRTPQHDHLTTSTDTTITSGTTYSSSSVVSGTSSSVIITGILEFLCIYVSMREIDAVITQSSGASASQSDTQLLLSIALSLSQRLAQFDTLTSTCCAGLRPLYTILCVQYELYFYALCAYCGVVTTSNCSSARQGVKQDPEVREQHIHTLQHIVETVFKPPSFRLTKACMLTGRRCVIKPSASVSGNLALRSAGQLSSWTGWWQRLYNKAFSSAYTDDINDPIFVLATMASTAAASSSSSRSSSSVTIFSSQLPVCLREYGNGFSVAKLQRLRVYLQHQLTAATTVVADCDVYATLAGLCAELAQGAVDSKDSAVGRSGVQGKSSEERSSYRTSDSGSVATSNSGSVATSNSSRSNSSSGSGNNSSALPHITTTKARPSSTNTARLLGQYSTIVNITTNTGASAAELCFTDVNIEKHSWECLPFITPLYEHLLQKIDVTEENCREELFIYVERLMKRMQT